ncbi:transcriptional regulator [Microbulbifer agarilyticus]|uniref:Transcriptional regulator n=1 Tax=Microbulbifer agarilyticus TaxID=260552 RepID=A0A1Q2MA71_9GAMM|nr:transcriptional regulator [Microbulbifer agarilyticus]
MGARLRAARDTAGISGKQVGMQIGMSPSQISKMESGDQKIPADLLPAWCEAVGISLAQAYGKGQSHHFAQLPFTPRIAKLYAELPEQWKLHAQRMIANLHQLYSLEKKKPHDQ